MVTSDFPVRWGSQNSEKSEKTKTTKEKQILQNSKLLLKTQPLPNIKSFTILQVQTDTYGVQQSGEMNIARKS